MLIIFPSCSNRKRTNCYVCLFATTDGCGIESQSEAPGNRIYCFWKWSIEVSRWSVPEAWPSLFHYIRPRLFVAHDCSRALDWWNRLWFRCLLPEHLRLNQCDKRLHDSRWTITQDAALESFVLHSRGLTPSLLNLSVMSWLIPLSMMLHLLMKAHPRVRAINWMRTEYKFF